jgi:hypothetical protein
MGMVTFYSRKFGERLERAGVRGEQALAMTEAFKDASGEAEITTRIPIAWAVANIKTEISGFQAA